MKSQKSNRGFTLIELLVVIAIIGILAMVVISNLSKAKSRAQDAHLLQVSQEIQKALELYNIDNGVYPPSVGWVRQGVNQTH